MKNVATIACSLLLYGLVFSACKNEACEQQRLDVSNQWQEVIKVAGRRAVSVAEAGGPADAWNKIKDQAELVHTSFATPQVTWAAAQNGRTKVRAQFKPFEASEDARAFKQALTTAEAGHDAFEKACR